MALICRTELGYSSAYTPAGHLNLVKVFIVTLFLSGYN